MRGGTFQSEGHDSFRDSGLDFLGRQPWGSHLCQFYHQKEDLLECLIPFFAAGLEKNEYCLWVTTGPVSVEEGYAAFSEKIPDFERYRKKKQIEILSSKEWYLCGNPLDPGGLIKKFREAVDGALSRKLAGMRAAGGLHKLDPHHWRLMLQYEESIHKEFPRFKAIALCTYSLPNCPLKNISKVIDCHHKTFLKKGWQWEVVTGLP